MSKLILFAAAHAPAAALAHRLADNLGYDCISLEEALKKEGEFNVPDSLGIIAPLGKITPDEKVSAFIGKFLVNAESLSNLGYLWFINPIGKGQSFRTAQAVTETIVSDAGMRSSFVSVLEEGEDPSAIESEIKAEVIRPPRYSLRACFIARRLKK